MPKFTWVEEMTGQSPGTATLRLKTQKLPDNETLCIQHVAVNSLTTATKTCVIGVITGNAVVWLKTIALTAAGTWYTLENPVFVKSCKGVVVDFLSPTANDYYQANVFGYYVD